MNEIDITSMNFSNDRAAIRKEIINLFLLEKPGTGKGDNASRYKYIVLKRHGHEVFLRRPAQFNNGFDFTLNVSGINFNPSGRRTTRPTHSDIIEDLFLKQQANQELFSLIMIEIDNIYNCLEPNRVEFDFEVGLDSVILLECIKWLFVEQDVTYWNYSGRAMFYDGIRRLES